MSSTQDVHGLYSVGLIYFALSFNPVAATTMCKVLTKVATEEAAHVSKIITSETGNTTYFMK